MIAAGVCLFVVAGLLQTRLGRLRLALLLLRAGNALIETATRLMEARR
ncbi:hypothetical protein [Mesorhizobium jarvisii]|nr:MULTISPECIES: hypothetical protein [Mesorhizobium]